MYYPSVCAIFSLWMDTKQSWKAIKNDFLFLLCSWSSGNMEWDRRSRRTTALTFTDFAVYGHSGRLFLFVVTLMNLPVRILTVQTGHLPLTLITTQNHLYLANTRAEVFSPAPETHCPAEFISSRSSVWLGLDLNSAGSGMKTWRIIPLSTLKGKMAPLNHSQSEAGQSDFSRAGLSSRNRRQAGSIGSCFPYFYFPQLMCLPLFA